MGLNQNEFAAVFEAVKESLFIFSLEGKYLKAPDGSDLEGNFLYEEFSTAKADELIRMIKSVASEKVVKSFEYSFEKGETRWCSSILSPVFDNDGEVKSVVWVEKDVTYLKEMEERLSRLDIKDHLTGINNRRYFFSELDSFFHRFLRGSKKYSLTIISIDGFEEIKDRGDRELADNVVAGFATVVKSFLRVTDIFASTGSNEFVILLPDTDFAGVKHVADRLLEDVREPILKDSEVKITASFGCSEVSKFDTSYDNVLNRAEIALYQAKQSGGDKVVLLDYASWKK